jgi:hypothetical protein
MLCSELEQRLKQLREEWGDLPVSANVLDDDILTVCALDADGQEMGFRSDPKTVKEFFIE